MELTPACDDPRRWGAGHPRSVAPTPASDAPAAANPGSAAVSKNGVSEASPLFPSRGLPRHVQPQRQSPRRIQRASADHHCSRWNELSDPRLRWPV
jgi:hypothetical protein